MGREPIEAGGMPEPGDRVITCVDCGLAFTFSAGEQEFYAEKDLSEPKRCKDCRAQKRRQREGGQ